VAGGRCSLNFRRTRALETAQEQSEIRRVDPERPLCGPRIFYGWFSSYRQRLDRLIGADPAINGGRASLSRPIDDPNGSTMSSQGFEDERSSGISRNRAGV
jgi:hypothetical protein